MNKESSQSKVLLALLICLLNHQAYPQTANLPEEVTTISSEKLIGKWHPVESTNSFIEFVDSLTGFVLKAGSHQIYCLEKDSLGNISSSGYYPQWPPPSCKLKLISADTLKVSYSNFMDKGVDFYYTRKKK